MIDLLHAARTAVFPPAGKLRFINFYGWHVCNLAGKCKFCIVPFHKVTDPLSGREIIMARKERREAFRRLRLLSVPNAIMSILGGETTLRPELLLEIVEDAFGYGFLVNVVTNGYALTPGLIVRLAKAGLHHLAISVDCNGGPRQELEKALELHQVTRKNGGIPVINVLVSSDTNISDLKKFCQKVIDAKCFVSLLAMSPNIGGMFSSADPATVPTNNQLCEIVKWLAWKKMTTGLITSSFGYLWTLYRAGSFENGNMKLWHCADHFRGIEGSGRGFITLDSDGTICPCQEYRSSLNILTIPEEHLSLHFIDEELSRITRQCEHCFFNCYIMEEAMHGVKTLIELPTAARFIQIKRAAHR